MLEGDCAGDDNNTPVLPLKRGDPSTSSGELPFDHRCPFPNGCFSDITSEQLLLLLLLVELACVPLVLAKTLGGGEEAGSGE